MCDTCGCQSEEEAKFVMPGKKKHSHHEHEHDGFHHTHNEPHEQVMEINRNLLHENDLMAERNRGFFEAKKLKAYNLVSSPGAGKTTLLEKTITALLDDFLFYVIAGDQQTSNDAYRIEKTGAKVIQVNTGTGCHLDAGMVHTAIKKLNPSENGLVMIENVGNLVCPALFDLGESERIVIISVTEGEDKPLKYPHLFISSSICIINKTDLLPHLKFDMNILRENIQKINHHLTVFELSAQTGDGLNSWFEWLLQHRPTPSK